MDGSLISNNKLTMMIVMLAIILFLAFAIEHHKEKIAITDYHAIFIPAYNKKGELLIAIRIFNINEKAHFLVVNPYSLTTDVVPVTKLLSRNLKDLKNNPNGYFLMKELRNTLYYKALTYYSHVAENKGMLAANHDVNGMFLTIDMCPSVKPFEKAFFNALVKNYEKNHLPTPIAISISGLWLLQHEKEFYWLVQQKNKLQITWINHSFSHVYYADANDKDNFLLSPRTNLNYEILNTEKMLLERHQKPSVFFRFPGLVTDKKLLLTINQYGLIPVSSNAWLAQGESPRNGSIILVHGNSNEPEGIQKFMQLLQQNTINLLPLNQAL